MASQRDALEGLLEICDEIRSLQDRAISLPTESAEDRRSRTRLRVRNLREEVFAALPSLKDRPAAGALSDPELLLLALFFHCKVSGREATLLGSDLVALLVQAGYPRVVALELLGPQASLMGQGWLRSDRPSPAIHFPLDARFQPTAEAMGLFWPTERSGDGSPLTEEPVLPYRSEDEHLWDLYRWRIISIQRASELFDSERIDAQPTPRHQTLRREARASLLRNRARLNLTPGSAEFRVETFRRQHRLGADELLLVLHLLFSELVDGEPFISALDGLRLVAETRTDLFRKRRLVSPKGRLRREGIVNAEGEEYSKALATDLSLADWAADELVAGLGRVPRLDDRELDGFLRGEE